MSDVTYRTNGTSAVALQHRNATCLCAVDRVSLFGRGKNDFVVIVNKISAHSLSHHADVPYILLRVTRLGLQVGCT